MTNGKKVNSKYGTFKSVNLIFTMLMLHPLSKHYCYASQQQGESESEIATKWIAHTA